MKYCKRIIICCLFVLITAGCASMPSIGASMDILMTQEMIPLDIPLPIETIEVYDDVTKSRIEVDVLSLESSKIRERLTSTETFISVEKRDSSGSLTYLGSGGRVSRGIYRVTFDYVNYMNQKVTFTDSDEVAVGKIGVGLRIIAELETNEDNVDLSGLLPLGLAAKDNKVTGNLKFHVYGISNDKISLAVPTESILDVSSIQKSFESAAAVRILFGLEETKLEPYLLGIADISQKNVDKAAENLLK